MQLPNAVLSAGYGYHPAVLKPIRLFQPYKPAFWLMLVLNLLSVLLVWVIENRPLSALGLSVVALLAIGNALWGAALAWRLMQPIRGSDNR